MTNIAQLSFNSLSTLHIIMTCLTFILLIICTFIYFDNWHLRWLVIPTILIALLIILLTTKTTRIVTKATVVSQTDDTVVIKNNQNYATINDIENIRKGDTVNVLEHYPNIPIVKNWNISKYYSISRP